jgi:hypothetical protein
MKIKGNTVGTPIPRSNYNQTDPKKADYLVGRENIVGKDNLASVTEEILAQAKASGEFNGSDGYTPVKGEDYFDGKDGTSVTITDITESDEDGGSNVVTFSDGKTLTVKNGNKGGDGEGGGNSVYFSEEEPTDAKTGDFWYDESEGESDEANADYIPVPQSANIGQTIVVKAVDENGKPTEWEAVDLPSGGSSGGKTFFLRNEDAYFGSSTEGIMIFVNPELLAEIEREVNGESVCSVRVIYEEDDGSKCTEALRHAYILSLPNGLTFADIYCSSTESIAVKTSEDADAVIAMISE